MAQDPVVNFGKVTVSAGYDNLATSIVLNAGMGAKLPQPSTAGAFNLVWWNSTDYADPSDDPNVEIVRCTARVTDTLTVTRAQEGTAASTKNTAGKAYKMILAATQKMMSDIATKVDSVVNVKDSAYGAKGDGTTDDTTAINNAIAALPASGGVLFFPAGTYIVSGSSYILNLSKTNLSMIGSGRDNTVIQIKNSNVSMPNASTLFITANGVTLRDFTLDGNIANNLTNVNYGGIFVYGKDDFKAYNIGVRNFPAAGIYLYSDATNTVCNRPIIEKCYVSNVGNYGIAASHAIYGKIIDNIVVTTGNHGIWVASRVDNISINSDSNIVEGNYVNRAAAPTKIYNSGTQTGFLVALDAYTTNTVIGNNILWDNRTAAGDGIGLGQVANGPITGLTITGNIVGYAGGYGIDCTASCTATGNYVYNAYSSGMVVDIDISTVTYSGAVLVGNIITNPNATSNTFAGVMVRAVAGATINHVVISDNVITDLTAIHMARGIDVTGAGSIADLSIQNNRISGYTSSSMRIDATSMTQPIIIDGNYSNDAIPVLLGNSTAPPVVVGTDFKTANTIATTITNFTQGFIGKKINVLINDGFTTLNFATGNLKGNGSVNRLMAVGDCVQAWYDGTNWHCWISNV